MVQYAPPELAGLTKGLHEYYNAVEGTMRQFDTGATRNSDIDKLAYKGFISPFAMRRFAQYMHKHRLQADGNLRAADNWKKGIPIASYEESLIRHVFDFWSATEMGDMDAAEELACAILFNAQGFLHETMKAKEAAASGRTPVAEA